VSTAPRLDFGEVTFSVFGDPKGQPRPRAFSRGGHARVFDPGTAEGWKSCIAIAARPHLPPKPLEGPLSVDLNFFFRRPKIHFKGQTLRAEAPRYHTRTPDADNLAKAVLDALTTLGMWHDDAQVADLVVRKWYVSAPTADGPQSEPWAVRDSGVRIYLRPL
jgi:Holliday junction resolvase RusA-like endonuclease